MFKPFLAFLALLALSCAHLALGQAQQQYPIADKVADKIIMKYQTSSCDQLKAQKAQGANEQHEEMQEKVMELLKKDPAMRKHFLDRIAGPIVNKMFECGMIH